MNSIREAAFAHLKERARQVLINQEMNSLTREKETVALIAEEFGITSELAERLLSSSPESIRLEVDGKPIKPARMKHQEFYLRLNLATQLLDDLDETATIRGIDLKAPFLSNGIVVISLSDKPAHLTNHETITIPFADGTGIVACAFYPALTENGIVAGYLTPKHTNKETA